MRRQPLFTCLLLTGAGLVSACSDGDSGTSPDAAPVSVDGGVAARDLSATVVRRSPTLQTKVIHDVRDGFAFQPPITCADDSESFRRNVWLTLVYRDEGGSLDEWKTSVLRRSASYCPGAVERVISRRMATSSVQMTARASAALEPDCEIYYLAAPLIDAEGTEQVLVGAGLHTEEAPGGACPTAKTLTDTASMAVAAADDVDFDATDSRAVPVGIAANQGSATAIWITAGGDIRAVRYDAAEGTTEPVVAPFAAPAGVEAGTDLPVAMVTVADETLIAFAAPTGSGDEHAVQLIAANPLTGTFASSAQVTVTESAPQLAFISIGEEQQLYYQAGAEFALVAVAGDGDQTVTIPLTGLPFSVPPLTAPIWYEGGLLFAVERSDGLHLAHVSAAGVVTTLVDEQPGWQRVLAGDSGAGWVVLVRALADGGIEIVDVEVVVGQVSRASTL